MHSCNSHRAEQNYAASLALCWGLALRKALCLISGSAATVLKFLVTLEQRDLRFRFALSLLCIMQSVLGSHTLLEEILTKAWEWGEKGIWGMPPRSSVPSCPLLTPAQR